MRSFTEFVDKKQRKTKRQLKIIKKVLSSQDFNVKDHLDDETPYIFVVSPKEDLSFGGIRVYSIGNMLAFRLQKEEKTEPIGKSYELPVEDMFVDLLSDYHKPEKAGEKVITYIADEIKRFFTKSAETENKIRTNIFNADDPFAAKIVIRNYGT